MSEDLQSKLDEVSIRVADLTNLVDVLNLALGLHQAEDIAKCHRNLVDVRYSPLTEEIKASRDRLEGHLQDYWAEKGKAAAKGVVEEDEYEEDEDDAEAALPPLPENVKPMGSLDNAYKAPAFEFEDNEDFQDQSDEEDDEG